ncbi:hypothetical protein O181_057294 [Austropuccinia psidii MF-1]|uniref:Uncharacterized protein n=1 Tax=Austropuccinia psidii MF-1 TaxID=1389203 RepID=A0A9Q3EAA8_9BASI|nr:hypothetical protein [Austropuccinia psidii MF-1]
MDVVHINSGRWKYMVVARDNFSGWPETVELVKLTAKAVAEWFTSEWIGRTGFSPFELQFGQLPVLPIDIETKTFLAIEWHKISTTEELLEARAKQSEGKEEMRRKAAEKLKRSKEDLMKYWDRRMAHQLRSPFTEEDLVLVYKEEI